MRETINDDNNSSNEYQYWIRYKTLTSIGWFIFRWKYIITIVFENRNKNRF